MTEAEHDVAAVLQAETDRCDAIRASDWERLEALLGDDLTYTHSTSLTETKAEFLAAIKQRNTSIERSNLTVHVFGDAAVMSGEVAMTLEDYNGQPSTTILFVALQVWVRRGGKWVLVAYNATRKPVEA